MTPSVEGGQKARVAVLLVATAAATGALAGFVLGLAGAAAAVGLTPQGLVVLVGAAVTADLVGIHPLAVARQVPRAWSALFGPETIAVLYGARLGVGPLTILPSWSWWAAALAGAALGPLPSAAGGAVFGAVRLLAVVALSEYARHAMASRISRLRAGEAAARWTTAGAALAVAAASLA